MRALLDKEFGLTGASITYFFIFTAGMAMIPNYPILVVTMLVSIGLIATFQGAREARDIDYFAILPIPKRDIVKAKYLFVMSIECLNYVLLIIIVVLRIIFLSNAQVYRENPMMNANVAYLGYSLVCYGMFNYFFLKTFFKTNYSFVYPSIFFFIGEFLCIGLFEALHHIPALASLNASQPNIAQIAMLIGGIMIYSVMTKKGYDISVHAIESMDLS